MRAAVGAGMEAAVAAVAAAAVVVVAVVVAVAAAVLVVKPASPLPSRLLSLPLFAVRMLHATSLEGRNPPVGHEIAFTAAVALPA